MWVGRARNTVLVNPPRNLLRHSGLRNRRYPRASKPDRMPHSPAYRHIRSATHFQFISARGTTAMLSTRSVAVRCSAQPQPVRVPMAPTRIARPQHRIVARAAASEAPPSQDAVKKVGWATVCVGGTHSRPGPATDNRPTHVAADGGHGPRLLPARADL